MKIIEKQVEFPGRRKIKKISEESNGDIIVDISKAEGNVVADGTIVDATLLNKINWRDDESICFVKMQSNELPEALADSVQIVTKANGETWLIPPLNLGHNIQLGKITGTTLVNENNLEMANAKVGVDFPSNNHISEIYQSINTNNANFNLHASDNDKHITSLERNDWNYKQNAITGGASSITSFNLTPNKVLLSDENGKVVAGSISASELLQDKLILNGATSNIQQQLNEKATVNAGNIVGNTATAWAEKICGGNTGLGDRIIQSIELGTNDDEKLYAIKYASGLILQWGRHISRTNSLLKYTITFPFAFSSKPTVTVSRGKPNTDNWRPSGHPVVANKIETGLFVLANSDNSNPMEYCWIAIGK